MCPAYARLHVKNVIILGKLFSRNISSPKFENVKAP